MMDFLDKIIVFLGCFTVYVWEPQFALNVVPVILVIIFTCALSFFDAWKIRAALSAGFFVLCFFQPGLSVFTPLIVYDVFLCGARYFCIAAAVPLILLWQNTPTITRWFTVLLLLFSLWSKYRTTAQAKLKSDYLNMRDTAKEMSIQLKKQNSDLMEKHDFEINIATLNERNRIAREIHDNVGHLLSSSILQVGALLAINKDETVKENLLVIKETLGNAMNSIRVSVHDLYDESIDLRAQMEKLADEFTFCPLSLDYDISGNPERKLKYAFLSIVKEALSNIMKHSNADSAKIVLREHPALYQLIITDNGTVTGYDPENGIGLKNISDRVLSFHGNINIFAKEGFQIFISIPKEEIRS